MSTHRFQHLRILASAGSGKTYQLTTRYLQLLVAGADPNSILATTFTRAAAGEIRDRLLRDLAEAAIDPNQRRALAKRLDQTALSEDDVLEILASLAGQLHRLQIRTLDSFFGTVVRSFALELGIGAEAGIVEQELGRRYRREAVRLMLDERDPQRLVDLLRKLTQGTSDRSVLHAIDRTVEGLYALYREADEYRDVLREFLQQKDSLDPDSPHILFQPEYMSEAEIDPEQIPRFHPRPLDLSTRLSEAMAPLLALLLETLAAIIFAGWAARRMEIATQ